MLDVTSTMVFLQTRYKTEGCRSHVPQNEPITSMTDSTSKVPSPIVEESFPTEIRRESHCVFENTVLELYEANITLSFTHDITAVTRWHIHFCRFYYSNT